MKRMLICLGILASITIGCETPNIPGSKDYKARVDTLEGALEKDMQSGIPLVVFRSSAPLMHITIETKSLRQSYDEYGPMAYFKLPTISQRYISINMHGDYNVPGDGQGFQQQWIQVYNHGILVAEKKAEGINEHYVSMLIR